MSDNTKLIDKLEFESSRPTVYLVQGSFEHAGKVYHFWYESDQRDDSDQREFTDSDGDYVHDLPEDVEDLVQAQAIKEVQRMEAENDR